MFMTSYLQLLIDNNVRLKSVFIENGWIEIDSVSDLLAYENMMKNNILKEIIEL